MKPSKLAKKPLNSWDSLSCAALVSVSVFVPHDLVPFVGSEQLPTSEHCLAQLQPVNNKKHPHCSATCYCLMPHKVRLTVETTSVADNACIGFSCIDAGSLNLSVN